MTTDVTINDPQHCWGVHWNQSLPSAEAQFRDWGFDGITNFSKIKVCNGNEARTEVRDIANRQGGNNRYFFSGSYDVGQTADSAIYSFDYSAYTGDATSSDPADKQFAGYNKP